MARIGVPASVRALLFLPEILRVSVTEELAGRATTPEEPDEALRKVSEQFVAEAGSPRRNGRGSRADPGVAIAGALIPIGYYAPAILQRLKHRERTILDDSGSRAVLFC